jgi:hypothetical protein
MPQTTEGGNFTSNDGPASNVQQDDLNTESLPHVLDFNWVCQQEDFKQTQYQYLASTVFENYHIHVTARRQSGMDKRQFLACLLLLYPQTPSPATNFLPDTGRSESDDGNEGMNMKKEIATTTSMYGDPSRGVPHASLVKQEKHDEQKFQIPTSNTDKTKQAAGTHARGTGVLTDTMVAAGQPQGAATVMPRDNMYREQQEELQSLVSAVLYLTELYGVAQTRGGAQVSQYRRTLTAQSHTMLVQRLTRELHNTDMGFWAWLERQQTPQQTPTTYHV